jgi:hypothetical protein
VEVTVRRWPMATRSAATRAVGVLADATGRTDEEVALALTVGAAAAALVAALLSVLHLFNFIEDLDIYIFGASRKRS